MSSIFDGKKEALKGSLFKDVKYVLFTKTSIFFIELFVVGTTEKLINSSLLYDFFVSPSISNEGLVSSV